MAKLSSTRFTHFRTEERPKETGFCRKPIGTSSERRERRICTHWEPILRSRLPRRWFNKLHFIQPVTFDLKYYLILICMTRYLILSVQCKQTKFNPGSKINVLNCNTTSINIICAKVVDKMTATYKIYHPNAQTSFRHKKNTSTNLN